MPKLFRDYLPYHKNVVVTPVVVTAETPVFTIINTLAIVDDLPAGEYKLTLGIEWFMLDFNDSGLFRVVSPLTQGTIYSFEPKDNSDLIFQTLSAPFTHLGGAVTFNAEASTTVGAQDLTVNWSAIEFERKT